MDEDLDLDQFCWEAYESRLWRPYEQPGRPLVVDVRPPSTLAPGQCFAALPDGRFQRRQLAPCLPAGQAENEARRLDLWADGREFEEP